MWLRTFTSVLVGVCVTAPVAVAQPEAPIAWEAPAGCPGQTEVAAEVARLLEGTPPVRAYGRVVRAGDRVRLRLELRDIADAPVRELEAGSCADLARAGALVIAIATRPGAFDFGSTRPVDEPVDVDEPAREAGAVARSTDGIPPPESASEPDALPHAATEPATATATAVEPGAMARTTTEPGARGGTERAGEPGSGARSIIRRVSVPTQIGPRSGVTTEAAVTAESGSPTTSSASDANEGRPSGPRVRFVGAVRALVSVGPLPAASPGLAVDVGVGVGAFEVTVGGVALAEQGASLGGEPAGGSFGLALARLRTCAVADLAPVEILPCAGVEVGGAWGRGEGVAVARQGIAPWVAATAGLDVRVRVVPFLALGASAQLEVPLLRSPFVLMVEGERRVVHQAFEVGTLLGIAATLLFE